MTIDFPDMFIDSDDLGKRFVDHPSCHESACLATPEDVRRLREAMERNEDTATI